jgi:hypothetical protein
MPNVRGALARPSVDPSPILPRSAVVIRAPPRHRGGVTSEDLTTEQARRIGDVVGRQLGYLCKLRERMHVMGFPPTDPLYADVDAAYKAVQVLGARLRRLESPRAAAPPPGQSVVFAVTCRCVKARKSRRA